MKVFISQRFRDIPEQEVLRRRQMIIDLAKYNYHDAEIIESWHPNFDKSSVAQLGQSIIEMSVADLVLISYGSMLNVFRFASDAEYGGKLDDDTLTSLRGSEYEILICRSYNIPVRVYKFIFDKDKNIPTGVQFIQMEELRLKDDKY